MNESSPASSSNKATSPSRKSAWTRGPSPVSPRSPTSLLNNAPSEHSRRRRTVEPVFALQDGVVIACGQETLTQGCSLTFGSFGDLSALISSLPPTTTQVGGLEARGSDLPRTISSTSFPKGKLGATSSIPSHSPSITATSMSSTRWPPLKPVSPHKRETMDRSDIEKLFQGGSFSLKPWVRKESQEDRKKRLEEEQEILREKGPLNQEKRNRRKALKEAEKIRRGIEEQERKEKDAITTESHGAKRKRINEEQRIMKEGERILKEEARIRKERDNVRQEIYRLHEEEDRLLLEEYRLEEDKEILEKDGERYRAEMSFGTDEQKVWIPNRHR